MQAMRPATERGPAAPPSARTRDHVMAGSPCCLCDRWLASGIGGDTLLGALEGWVGLSAPCTKAMAVAQER
jgi:hypothetical protein